MLSQVESHSVRATGVPVRYEVKVLAEQVRLLYAQSIPGFIATLVNSVLLVVVLWPQVEHRALIAWLVVMICVTAVRFSVVLAYRSATDRLDRAERWLRRFAMGVIVTGALWGIAGTTLFPAGSEVHQMFILIVLAGMSAGAVPFLSSAFPIYAGYVLPMLLPLAFDLWLQPDLVHKYIAVMVLLYLGLLLGSARRIANNFRESMDLRFERAALVDELAQANERLATEAEQRKRTQHDLQESYRFMQQIMDSASDAIVVLGADGRLQRANPAMARLSGHSLESLAGVEFATLFSGDSTATLESALGSATTLDEARVAEDLELERPDGTRRTVNISLAPVREEHHGAARALVGIGKDVTERRKLERLKDEFLATVSHELRTPLTSIRGALGLIGRAGEAPMPEATRSLLEIADRNSERLLQLIDDLLDLQGLEAARPRLRIGNHIAADLVEHAAAVSRADAQQGKVGIEILAPLSRASVQVDRERTAQILAHLLSNAVRFSPPGATVSLETEERDGFVRISIRDQGPGIPEEFRERIFQRFAQAETQATWKKRGAGIGLSISKTVAEAMGGNIGFMTEPGQGSTFYVDLPRTDSAQEPQ